MKYVLHFLILIATTVLVKSAETSHRTKKQIGYFYNKPKIAFEEGNSVSEYKNARVTSSRKPISVQQTETKIENNLNFQGYNIAIRKPILSVDLNTERNIDSGTSKNKLVSYQQTTFISPQISKNEFEASSKKFGQKVITQSSKLLNQTNEVYKPSFIGEQQNIIVKTNTLQNQQYLKQNERTQIISRPVGTQSPFNLYIGGGGQKINQKTFFQVDEEPIDSLKPRDSIVTAPQISIKRLPTPQKSKSITAERNEGYVYSKSTKVTDIPIKKSQLLISTETSKTSSYKPILVSHPPNTQPSKTPSISKPSSNKPQSSRFIPGTGTLGSLGQLSVDGPTLISQTPSYQIPITRRPAYDYSIRSNQQFPSIASNTTKSLSIQTQTASLPTAFVGSRPAQVSSIDLRFDRPSSIPKLPSYQTQNIINSEISGTPSTQSKISATANPFKKPLSSSFAGYVYEVPKKPFEEIPSINPTSSFSKVTSYQPPKTTLAHSSTTPPLQTFSKVPSYQPPKTKLPHSSTTPSLQTSDYKPYSSKPLLYKPTSPPQLLSFQESTSKPSFYNEILSHQISGNQEHRITSTNYNPSSIPSTKFPKYKPTSASKISSPQTIFSTKINYSTSTYRPTFLDTTVKSQTPTGYIYEKPKNSLKDQPSEFPKLNQSPFPKSPSSYERPKFPVSYTQVSSVRPLNKPLQISSTYATTKIQETQKYLETSFLRPLPASASQLPFQQPSFTTKINYSTSTYRPTFSIQTLETGRPLASNGYSYDKLKQNIENQPSKVPKLTTFIESSSYRPQIIYNPKLNQPTVPQTPYSYKRPQFQVSYTQDSSVRPLNKPLKYSSTSTQIPETQKYLETSSHRLPAPASLFNEPLKKPGYYSAQVTQPAYKPSKPLLPYEPSQIKLSHKPIQSHTQDRPSKEPFSFKPPQISSSKPPTYYQQTKITPHEPSKQFNNNKPTLPFLSFNYPQTQTSNGLPQTSVGIKPSHIVPSLNHSHNLPSYNRTSQTVATYEPIKYSIQQQKETYYKPSKTAPPYRPPLNPSPDESIKTSRPYKVSSSFTIPSEPPVNIFSKPISSPNSLLTNSSSTSKPQQIYTRPLSRYPTNKPIFQGPAYIPPLKPSSQKQFTDKPNIPVRTTEKTLTYANSSYKAFVTINTTRKPFTDSNFTFRPYVPSSTSQKLFTYAPTTYKPLLSSQTPFTSAFSSYIPYRPVSTTEKPYTYETTIKPNIYTPSTYKPYIPIDTSRKLYIQSSSTIRPFISTSETKKPFIPSFSVYKPHISDDTTEKILTSVQSAYKPYVTVSNTEKPFSYAPSTNKPYISVITSQKPLTYTSPIYKTKPLVPVNDIKKTFAPAFSSHKPYIPFSTTNKPHSLVPSTYKTDVSARTTRKPFVSISTSRKPFTSATSTYKPFVPVSVTQKPFNNQFTTYKPNKYISTTQKTSTYAPITYKPYVAVSTTKKPFSYAPVTNKSNVSVSASIKPFTDAASTYKPFIQVSDIQKPSTTLLSTIKPYTTIRTTEKPSRFTTSTYKPYVSVSTTEKASTDSPSIFGFYEPARTTRKPFSYIPSTYKPFVPVSETQKPFISSFTTYKPIATVSNTKKPHEYTPFPYKPEISTSKTQKPFSYVPSTVPVVVINTTKKPFTYASTQKHFTVPSIPSKAIEYGYTTQKSITKFTTSKPLIPVTQSIKPLIPKLPPTQSTIFKTTAYPVPSKRPSTIQEDRSYLPPEPEGYFYPKPKKSFNFK